MGPVPTGPVEAQGSLCTKVSVAKIKNKRREASTTPYRYWQSWQAAHATITAVLVYKSLSMKLHHRFHSCISKVKSSWIFIHQGKPSGIHMLQTGLESSLTQHSSNVLVELLVHVVHSGITDTLQKGGHSIHNFLS